MTAHRYVYLHGFASGPGSRKARFFRERMAEKGIDLAVPDLAAGKFSRLTLSAQLAVLDHAVAGAPATLIGSSMGGYLAAIYAATHPEIETLILLAPAFHFRELWEKRLGPDLLSQWEQTGHLAVYHYATGREELLEFALMRDAALYPAVPDFRQPSLFIHGSRDDVVPPLISEQVAALRGNRQVITVDAGHELTDVLPEVWSWSWNFLSKL